MGVEAGGSAACPASTDAKLFQAPYRAGIEVKAYQLEPLRKALLLPRVNLFIADDVGLGKTIEAGLILRELLMRQKARRVVVAAPPSVVRQWQEEMEQRFGLTFVVYDREWVTTQRRERGYGVNPWRTHTRFVISHALLRDEAYAAPPRDWLADEDAGAAILILDEAHNAAPASSQKYAIDSKFTKTGPRVSARTRRRCRPRSPAPNRRWRSSAPSRAPPSSTPTSTPAAPPTRPPPSPMRLPRWPRAMPGAAMRASGSPCPAPPTTRTRPPTPSRRR
jgi:hypothetical protein